MLTNIYLPETLSAGFDEPVLYAPARVEASPPATRLQIVTGFTDTERISTHCINLQEGIKTGRFVRGISIDIILGMTKSSLSQKKHEDIKRLIGYINGTRDMPKLSCRYICSGQEVHTKMYWWSYPKADQGYDLNIPTVAYTGSLNYTMNAFYKRREYVTQMDTMAAYKYWQTLLPDTLDCQDPLVYEKLSGITNGTADEMEAVDNSESEYKEYDQHKTPIDTITVSLLRADGTDTGYGSGVNWGIRPNGTKRNQNQAYIPYNAQDKKPGFFPDRIHPDDENCPMFRVLTKDFGSFHMRMAQAGNKGLQSVESNAILGEWIRKRIGQTGYVTKQMLEHYGKTYVTFRKYGDGTYLLDF